VAYSAQQTEHLNAECRRIADELQALNFEGLGQSNRVKSDRVIEHLRHGAGRRLGILKRSMEEIFSVFPPAQERPLGHDRLVGVQINLHAFVINLAGIFDNWAWAFIFRHELLERVGGRINVGLFKSATLRFLPAPLRDYLTSRDISSWQDKYLKSYRDALAQRIPLYIPPAAWSPEDTARYERLEQEKVQCILSRQWERLVACNS